MPSYKILRRTFNSVNHFLNIRVRGILYKLGRMSLMTGPKCRCGAGDRPFAVSPQPFPGVGSPVKSIFFSWAGGKTGLGVPLAWEEPGPGQCVGAA